VLNRLLRLSRPAAERVYELQHEQWTRLRPVADDESVDQVHIAMDDLYGEEIYQREQLVLFTVGSLCLEAGQRELWARIYAATAAGPVAPGEELSFLEETAAAVRSKEL
jgi:hypothetical protein